MKFPPIATVRKAIANVCGLIAVLVVPALPLFHEDARIEAGAIAAIAAAVLHYLTPPNAPKG